MGWWPQPRRLLVAVARVRRDLVGASRRARVAMVATDPRATRPSAANTIRLRTFGAAEGATTEVVLGDEQDDCRLAMMRMDQANIRHLPVMRDGRVVSMLSVRDLMRAELVEAGVELEFLKQYLYQG